MSTLFEELGGKIPVWGISHGGHSLPENDSGLPDLNGKLGVAIPWMVPDISTGCQGLRNATSTA